MTGVLISLFVLVIAGYLILTKAKPQVVLICAGILLMVMGTYLGMGEIFPKGKGATGSLFLDIYEKIRAILISRVGGLGLSIMAVGGYARYMDKIGASRAMVQVLSQPLKMIKSPYYVLSGTFIIGQIMALFITSASGLGMLLMVTLYPTLINTGVTRLSAVAVIGTTMVIEWGVLDSITNFAAQTANMPVTEYFLNYQVKVGCSVIFAVAVAHFFVQRWFDKRGAPEIPANAAQQAQQKLETPPLYYAILPTLPLVLLICYMVFANRNINLVTIMMISVTVTMLFHFFHSFKIRDAFGDIQAFFDGMGTQFANVVTLIVAGETFAHGLATIGAVDTAINAAKNSGLGGVGVLLLMVMIIAVCTMVMGSGNAPFFSFASLVPNIAAGLNVPAVAMIMPMHFATSLARGMSPITAVIVVTAGIADVSPFDVVKRTAFPILVGMATNLAVTITLFF